MTLELNIALNIKMPFSRERTLQPMEQSSPSLVPMFDVQMMCICELIATGRPPSLTQ